MAISRVALLGAPQGPWVPLAHLVNPHLRVTGLSKDSQVVAVVMHNAGRSILEIAGDGVHLLPLGDWVMVQCIGPHESVVCHAVSRKAA